MSGYISEFFGYRAEDKSKKADTAAAEKICPFLGTHNVPKYYHAIESLPEFVQFGKKQPVRRQSYAAPSAFMRKITKC